MPHPRSAAKRHRQSLRRRERNLTRRTAARGAVRKAREAITSGSPEEAETAIRAAASTLDRAARKHVIHPNNAARRKSRLMRQLHTTQSGKAEATTARAEAAPPAAEEPEAAPKRRWRGRKS